MLYLLHIKTKNVGTNIFTRIYFMFLIVHKVCTNYIIFIEFYTNNTSIIFRRVSEATKERARLLGRTIAKEGNQILIISFTTFHHLGRFFYISRKDDKSVQELQQKRLSAAATNLPEESCPNKTQFKNQILNKLKTVSVLKIRLHESLLWVWPYLGVLGVFKKVSFYG